MADYNYITELGVIVPDTSQTRAEVEQDFKDAFGQDFDVSPETPQGVFITAEVEGRDSLARNNATLANQINPNEAGGIFLDAIWSLTAGSRRAGTRSIVSGAVFGGVPGTIIPQGSLATVNTSGEQFFTLGEYTIGSGGTITGDLEAVDIGPISAPVGSLDGVASSVLGWETITNPTAAAIGQNEETDVQSRSRRRNTLALQGVALSEAILSGLFDVDDVRSAVLRENVTDTPATIDGILIPAHSIYTAVFGGTNEDIALSLLDNKSLGCGWEGNTLVQIVGSNGQIYDVEFERPTTVPVWVRVTANYNGTDGASIIPEAIEAYADGNLDGQDGFVIGADVNPFELSGAINQVEPRIFVVNVELSTDGVVYSSAPVPVDLRQIAQLAVVTTIPVT